MPKREQLPQVVHDHFRKANVLHTYVEKELGEARNHALEIGQELLAAKKAIPHGGWEDECERLFDGSLRGARFYMGFAKDIQALPKTATVAVLMLEGTLVGAAKAARAATKPKPAVKPKPSPPSPPKASPAKAQPDYGKCPNCAGVKWTEDEDGVVCKKCNHPHGEPAGDRDEDRIKTQKSKTVKTCEALLRAFDDLQTMKARPEYDEAILRTKQLLAIARGWK